MHNFYKSVTTNWSYPSRNCQNNKTGKCPDGVYGKRTEVVIKNGTGYKVNDLLNNRGHTKKRIKQKLSKAEVKSVMNGQFIPGFWENCKHGACKTMRNHK